MSLWSGILFLKSKYHTRSYFSEGVCSRWHALAPQPWSLRCDSPTGTCHKPHVASLKWWLGCVVQMVRLPVLQSGRVAEPFPCPGPHMKLADVGVIWYVGQGNVPRFRICCFQNQKRLTWYFAFMIMMPRFNHLSFILKDIS